MKTSLRRRRLTVLLTALVAAFVPAAGAQAAFVESNAVPTELFFSEYVEGSSFNKAVEIYNGTGAAIDLTALGYNVQLFSNGATTASSTQNLTGTIAAGDVFVVAHTSAALGGFTPDQRSGTVNFNGDDAFVLRRGTTIIDVIGRIGERPTSGQWGTDPTSTADNTIRRKPTIEAGDTTSDDPFDPATEWDGFANDTFDGLGSHTIGPPPANDPVVADCGPNMTTAEGYPRTTSVTAQDPDGRVTSITVSNVTPSPAPGSITRTAFTPASAAGGTASANVTVDAATPPATYTVEITATNDDATPQSDTCTLTVTVADLLPIGAVQGVVSDSADVASHRSPYAPPLAPTSSNPCAPNTAGTQTIAVQGVIYQKTLARTNTGGFQHGFHIQNTDQTDDNDPLTSDGVFVFMGSFTTLIGGYAPQVGDEVVITARVTEFFCLTELTSASLVAVVGAGPAPVDVVVPPFIADPPDSSADAGRYWERREGMRGRVPAGSLVVDSRDVFGSTFDAEVWVMRADEATALRADPFARRVFRDPHPLDNRPEPWDDLNGYRIMLASHALKANASGTLDERSKVLIAPARTYDTVANSPVGGVTFTFNKYGLEIDEQLTLVPGVDPSTNAPPTAPARPQEYSMADYNVENLYDFRDDPFDGCDFTGNSGCPGVNPPFDYVPESQADYLAHVNEIAAQVLNDLHAPEILLVQEAEDQDICSVSGTALTCGATNNADGRPDTLQELALAIRARGGPVYEAAYDRDGADDRGIVSGFLYRTDRVELLPAPAGDPILGSSPTVSYRGAPLAYNTQVQNPKVLNAALPADVDRSTGTDGSSVFTRPPQVGLFRIWELPGRTGNSFDVYAISNHFSSTPDARVGQRREQAAYNAAIAAAIEAARPGARIAIGGDFNVYPRPDDPFPPGHRLHPSDQLGPLYAQGLVNLWDVLVAEVPVSAYSYIFQGQTQTLDQHFVSPLLRNELRQFRMAHVNADWPADHEGDGARGASDHDPGVARFAAPAALAGAGITKAASTDRTSEGGIITYTLTVRNAGPSSAANVVVTDPLPAGLEYLSATASQGSCSAGPPVTCSLGMLASGASARVVIDARATQQGEVTNEATVRADTNDPSAADNTARVTTTVGPAPFQPPTVRDCRVTASPSVLRVGRRAAVRVSVARLGPREPAGRALVRLRGAGVSATARTNAGGTVRLVVRPTRAGRITVTAPELARCSASIRVRPAPRVGPALTGRHR